jgi:hypothetical protein
VRHTLSEFTNACVRKYSKNENGLKLFSFHFTLSITIYVLLLGQAQRFYSEVIQFGDPYTYVTGYFELLDNSRGGFQNLITEVSTVLQGKWNWYWFQDLIILIFSPLLSKEESNLIVFSFILLGVSCFTLNLLLSNMIKNNLVVILLSLIPWIYPVNYGYLEYASLGVMGLDSNFLPLLASSIFLSTHFAINSSKRNLALVSAFFTCLTIWARGNSIVIVVFVLFPVILYFLLKKKGSREKINLFIYLSIVFFATYFYYKTNWGPLTDYYSNHVEFAERVNRKFDLAIPYLLNIPGYMFISVKNYPVTILLSYLIHVFSILTLLWFFYSFKNKKPFDLKFLMINILGHYIYWGTFLINLYLWIDPLITLENALLIWRPMLIGLTLIFTSFFASLIKSSNRLENNSKSKLIIPVIFPVFFVYVIAVNMYRTPDNLRITSPSPNLVQRVAEFMDIESAEAPVSVLWLQPTGYSPTILNYYSRKYQGVNYFINRGEFYNNLWTASDYSPKNSQKILEELKWQFQDSGVILLPEKLNMYKKSGGPYAFYREPEAIMAAFESVEKVWNFEVIASVEDTVGEYLIVLKKSGGENSEKSKTNFEGWDESGNAIYNNNGIKKFHFSSNS